MLQYSFFCPGWSAGYWVWLTSIVLLYSSIHSYPSQCGCQLSIMGSVVAWMPSSSSHCPSGFSSFRSIRGWSVGILPYHSMSALLHLGNPITSGGLGVDCLQPSLKVSGMLCLSSSCINFSSSVQVPGRTCQRSTQTFDSDGTMLDWGSLASHSSQHVSKHSSVLSCHKRSHHGCFGRPGTQGSAISPLTLWLLWDMYCANKGSLPQSVQEW